MKTFGAPVIAANLGGSSPVVKDLVVKGTTSLGADIGGAVGAGVDSLTGFTDQGVFTAGLSKEGGKLGANVGTRLTTRPAIAQTYEAITVIIFGCGCPC